MPDPKEVAEVIEAPLSLLLNQGSRKSELVQDPELGRRRIPYFAVQGHKVWGATAMVLAEFLSLLQP